MNVLRRLHPIFSEVCFSLSSIAQVVGSDLFIFIPPCLICSSVPGFGYCLPQFLIIWFISFGVQILFTVILPFICLSVSILYHNFPINYCCNILHECMSRASVTLLVNVCRVRVLHSWLMCAAYECHILG